MKQKLTDKSSRRKFLSFGLLSGAGLLSQKVNAMVPDPGGDDTVHMLTPDGKLVEVSKKILEKSGDREKASNEKILKWTNTQNKSGK
ncbi:MAG: hypothetical protein WBP41_18760 [Saprospiraceae bacterium]